MDQFLIQEDSVLTEFSSAVNAVECGVEFQRAIKEKFHKTTK